METNYWICDNCGSKIESIDQGWIEWKDGRPKHSSNGLRLVHHVKCRYRNVGSVSDGHLREYLGHDGLMSLIALAKPIGNLPTEEVFEMIKRLFIPGYEKARLRAKEALGQGVFEPNMPDGIYFQDQIKTINNWIDAGN